MNPKVFGWQHFTYLAVCIVISIISIILIKKYVKKEKYQDIVVKCIGGILLALILWNRIEIVLSNKNWAYLIPNTFCGMSSLVLALTTLLGKRNNNVLHFVFYLAFVGCVATLIYPDFIGQSSSIFYGKTISGLMHHTVSLYLCILMCTIGWFVPDYKKSWNLVVGFLAYITLGAFLISVLDIRDSFYIYDPILSGTPLTVWVLMPIFVAVYVLFMVIYELVKKKIKIKKQQNINSLDDDKNSKSKEQ